MDVWHKSHRHGDGALTDLPCQWAGLSTSTDTVRTLTVSLTGIGIPLHAREIFSVVLISTIYMSITACGPQTLEVFPVTG